MTKAHSNSFVVGDAIANPQEVVEKVCADAHCDKEFVPSKSNQRFCCAKCRLRTNNHKVIAALTAEQKAARYAAISPESKQKAQRKRRLKQATKTYLSGRLPKWMFS